MPTGRGGKESKSTPLSGHSKKMGRTAIKERAQKRAEHRAQKAATKVRRPSAPPPG